MSEESATESQKPFFQNSEICIQMYNTKRSVVVQFVHPDLHKKLHKLTALWTLEEHNNDYGVIL